MSDRDPFADFDSEPEDLERTIIVPAPGGKRRGGESPSVPRPTPGPAPTPSPSAAPRRASQPLPDLEGSGHNPLVSAAGTAFALVRRLRDTAQHPDPEGLRQSVLGMVQTFETQARALGAATETAYAARYALCALIDETVLVTPWGSQSQWTHQSLLVTLHNETRGGAKFFQILDRMLENPARNIDLLEFLFLCLSLGFQGKYGVVDGGGAQLESITQNLYRTIRNQRGEIERELSPHWVGMTDRRPKVARFVPIWVVPVAVAALAVLMFMGFGYSINSASDPVFAELNGLGREAAQLNQLPRVVEQPIRVERVVVAEAPPPERPADRLRGILQPEIDKGLVEVQDLGNATNIRVHNLGLFPSGSAQVTKEYEPVLRKIAIALQDEPEPLLVTGHTDSDPVSSRLKFPSNWHLSVARAKSVAGVLSRSLDGKKLEVEGRGADAPVAQRDYAIDDQSAEGKRINRRVDIRVPVR